MALKIPANAVADEEENTAPVIQVPSNAVEADTAAPDATLGDKALAAGQGAARGFADALPMVGGTVGAILGAGAGAPTGPGAVATGAAGMALGAGAGTAAKGALYDFFDIPTVEEMPENLRPYGYGGQTVGGALPFAAVPVSAIQSGFRTVGRSLNLPFGINTPGRMFDRIIETAIRRPKAFAATEAGAAVGSGIGAGTAEAAFPDNTGARIGGELVGGLLAPGGLIMMATDAVRGVYQRAMTTFSRTGRESAAANEVARILNQSGQDPNVVAQQIADAQKLLPRGANPSSGQLTGNPVLIAMEEEIGRRNAKFGRDVRAQGQGTLETLRTSADALAATGDPAALREASVLHREYFSAAMESDLAHAEQQAVEAAARIGPNDEQSISEISRRTAELLDESLSNARARERALYAEVPNGPAGADAISATAAEIEAEDLASVGGDLLEMLPPLARRFVEKVNKLTADSVEDTGIVGADGKPITRTVPGNPQPVTIDEVRKLRSRMLDEARTAAASGSYAEARIYGKLAEAALEDLNAVTEAGGALDLARNYSRALNDTYTRSFAGSATADAKTGGRRLPPELLLRRAAGTGQELGALRMRELRQAVEFGSPEAGAELLASQEQFLRSAADALVNPETGVVTPRTLAQFRRRNAETLAEFPALDEQLRNASDASAFLRGVRTSLTQTQRALDQQAFSKLAGAENPAVVIARILNGPQPASDFRQLATLARLDGPDAVGGLARSTLDEAFQRAGGAESFSFRSLRDQLYTPRRGGEQQSTIDLLRRNRVMSAEELDRLDTLIAEGERVERALQGGEHIDSLLESENAMVDLAMRISGAKVGTAISGTSGGQGHGLLAAAAGIRFVRRVLDKIPAGKVQEVLIEAAKDPAFMEVLLRKGKTPRDKINIGQKLNAYLLNLGLVQLPDEAVEQEPSSE